MDEQRIAKMKTYFENFLTSEKNIIPRIEGTFSKVQTAIQEINPKVDIDAFVTANKSGRSLELADAQKPLQLLTIAAPSGGKAAPPKTATRQNSSSTLQSPVSRPMSAYSTTRSSNKAVALFDYSATDRNELSFKKGQIISVLQKDDSGWWQGELDGVVGMFPSNFVREGEDSSFLGGAEDGSRQVRVRSSLHTFFFFG